MGHHVSWLGIDIGGANLKLSDGVEYSRSRRFSMWECPDDLAGELRHAISEAPPSDHLAVTMTGELADCFATKTDGVLHILDAVEDASDGRHTRVYLTDGRLVTPTAAKRSPLLAAASNWHALANFARRFVPAAGLLVDMGSTTTDIIPITHDAVCAKGRNDTERLLAGELWYSGVARNPTCAVVQSVPYRGQPCSVAQEYFATMRDVYLMLGKLSEAPTDTDTADRRPATKAAARVRLARMICADETQFHHRDAATIAQHIAAVHLAGLKSLLVQASESMSEPPGTVVVSGAGEFVVLAALKALDWEAATISLQTELGTSASQAAPAYALALLAAETRSA